MSGWNGARGLVAGTTSTTSRYFLQQLESPALASRVRGHLPRPHVATRTLRTMASPMSVQCRRDHRIELEFNKSQIRTHIRMLELGRRGFNTTSLLRHGHIDAPKPGEELHVTFVDKDGDHHEFEVSKGDNLLDIAQANDLEMEGACGGSCACSTCHVIVDGDEMYDKMEEPSDDENDMLDLAFGLTETSRLGCQVLMSPELDGLVVKLPKMTRNMQASDFEKS